jgi:2-oxoglutarate/2-oxoacid ferredoxin oxidoreductase subunit beta
MTNVIAMDEMKLVRGKPEGLTDRQHPLCPGCGESIAGRVIVEVLEEMNRRDTSILAMGVGCSGQLRGVLDIDVQSALHGRAPALATGIKRALPDTLVFTLQGDGDLISEGVSEAVQAAVRGENITVICLNNAVNAETGSHMTAASMVGQRTKTTLGGRSAEHQGVPLRMAELLAGMDGTVFSARSSMHKPAEIMKAKKFLRRAFELQLARRGFSYVELLTMCPTGWFMEPVESIDYIEDVLSQVHTLGVVKDTGDRV